MPPTDWPGDLTVTDQSAISRNKKPIPEKWVARVVWFVWPHLMGKYFMVPLALNRPEHKPALYNQHLKRAHPYYDMHVARKTTVLWSLHPVLFFGHASQKYLCANLQAKNTLWTSIGASWIPGGQMANKTVMKFAATFLFLPVVIIAASKTSFSPPFSDGKINGWRYGGATGTDVFSKSLKLFMSYLYLERPSFVFFHEYQKSLQTKLEWHPWIDGMAVGAFPLNLRMCIYHATLSF